jgi:phospholipid/cholesterol/gamma-HCH transport system substrate-binding protein
MKRWRLVANLVAFGLAAAALVAYGVLDLLGDPFASATEVSAVFPDASGLYKNFTVWLDGVEVGSVSGVHLVRQGAEVTMRIKPGVAVPADVVASIDIANDLGEQVVELTPRGSGRGTLHSGDVVPVVPGTIPVEVGKVVASATRLLAAIPAGDLNRLLAETATALQGRAADLKTIVSASTSFSQQFLQYQAQVNALLANAPPVMDTLSSVGPQLRQALANTEAVVGVLAARRADVSGVLAHGQAATGLLGTLVRNQSADLGCLIHDVSQLNANLDQPGNLSNLSGALSLNNYFFGTVTSVAQPGTSKPLVSGAQANPSQTMLRVRILLPPATPAGDAYAVQQAIPPVRPGAACTTEFGKGVGASSQAGFTPAAGGQLEAPTQADSVVRGGGDGSSPSAPAPSAAASLDAPGPPAGLLVAGLVVVPALALAWGARPSRRRTRRRA